MVNNRLRILRTEQLINELTDEEHPLNGNQLVDLLLDRYNLETERKAVYNDIKFMKDADIDIASCPEGFYRLDRLFELQELKLMADAILSSKFLPEKDTKSLLEKIKTLCSVHEAHELQRQVVVSNRVKNMNKQVFRSLDVLNRAINENLQVSFKYFNYDMKKEIEYRYGGYTYERSPYMLLYEDDFYYVLLYGGSHNSISPFRVDRMADVKLLEDKPREGQDVFEKLDKRTYTQYTFGMYSGDIVRVDILFNKNMMNVVIDKFGKDVWSYKVDKDHFKVTVPVAVSPQFFGWLCGLGDNAEIIGPLDVREKFIKHINSLSSKYVNENPQ